VLVEERKREWGIKRARERERERERWREREEKKQLYLSHAHSTGFRGQRTRFSQGR
jgi:hypothetical protein